MPSCSIGFWVASTRNRSGQREGLAADGHLLLLHRLQQRALHLGGRAVDLVRQQEVGEDRPLLHREVAGALVVDHGADQIGGEQIGGELDPVESGRDGGRQGPHRQGLGQAGHTLQQHVAIGEQADEESLQHRPLAHDDAAQLLHQLRGETRVLLELRGREEIRGGAFG